MTHTIAGAALIFSVNNVDLAIAQNFSYEWNHETDDIRVVDELESQEHAEIGVTTRFTVDTFRVYNHSATSLGIQPRLNRILTQPELTVSLRDKVTGKILQSFMGVKLVGRSGKVGARNVWTESLSFVARKAFDEGTL